MDGQVVQVKHSRATRWMHWINFPVLTIMIWSGIRIYWAFDLSRTPWIRFGEDTLFPAGFYETLQLDRKLARGMAFHFSFGWLFLINGAIFVGYLAFSGRWRELVPTRSDLGNLWGVLLHDLGIRKEAPPADKYNAAQKFAYTTVLVMGFLALASGFAIYKPTQLGWLTALFGGYTGARLVHFIVSIGFVAFFGIHLLQVARAGFSNFWSMIVGREVAPIEEDAEPTRLPVSQSRRSMLTGALGVGGAFAGWRWIQNQPTADRIPQVLRDVHELNGSIWQRLYSEKRLARMFDPSEARPLRVNGRHGVREEIDLDSWVMKVVGRNGDEIGTHRIEDVTSLPFTEMTVEHKCVEGWSEIVTWGGTPFANLAAMYGDETQAPYVALETPDGDYYVSLDRDSMLHPQTLLCWELNGEPLTQLHGAPLRLVTPLKYGIKQIKRIGTITFSDERLPDYWAERGYDWYSGL